jgi:hypothetical protein
MTCEHLTSQIVSVTENIPVGGNAARHIMKEVIILRRVCQDSGHACIFTLGSEPSDKKDCGYFQSLLLNNIPVPGA